MNQISNIALSDLMQGGMPISDYAKYQLTSGSSNWNLDILLEEEKHRYLPGIEKCIEFFLEYSDEEFQQCIADGVSYGDNVLTLVDHDNFLTIQYVSDYDFFKFTLKPVGQQYDHDEAIHTTEWLLASIEDNPYPAISPLFMKLIARTGRWEF